MIVVHKDRYSTTGVSLKKRGVVVHTSESPDGSILGLLAAMERPGDHAVAGTNPVRYWGSSYHALAQSLNSTYIEVQPASHGPYSAPPLNKDWWHICIPGYAAQTRAEWLEPVSRAQIRGVAKYIVDKSRSDGFPALRVTASQLALNGTGYCGHVDVSNAFHQTDHTDPGVNFPWDVLAADIKVLLGAAPVPPAIDPLVPKPVLRRTVLSPIRVNAEVVKLQNALLFWRWGTSPADGKFGYVTEAGVRKMQAALKLPATGTYDAATAAAYKAFLIGMAATR